MTKAEKVAMAKMDANTLRRKADQAWECAGCARQDHDKVDAERWTAKAQEYQAALGRLLRGESTGGEKEEQS